MPSKLVRRRRPTGAPVLVAVLVCSDPGCWLCSSTEGPPLAHSQGPPLALPSLPEMANGRPWQDDRSNVTPIAPERPRDRN